MEERGEKLLSAEENDRPRRSVEGMKSEMPSVMKTGTRNAHTRGSRVSDSAGTSPVVRDGGREGCGWGGRTCSVPAACQPQTEKGRGGGGGGFYRSTALCLRRLFSFRLSEQKLEGMGR